MKLIVCFWLALTGAIVAQVIPTADETSTAISKLREGLVSAITHGDIEGLLGYLDPAVIVTWQNGEVCRGPAEVRAFYQRMMAGEKRMVQSVSSEPEFTGRQVYSDGAVLWGNLHDRFVSVDGSELTMNSVFTATIARRGDRWLVTAFHSSINAFQNPILGAAVKRVAMPLGLGSFIGGLVLGLLARYVFRTQGPGVMPPGE